MNSRTFEFEPLVRPRKALIHLPLPIVNIQRIEERYSRDVFSCILHSVIFQRALGKITPEDDYIEFLDVSYAQCTDAKLKKVVADKIEAIKDILRKRESRDAPQKFNIQVSFYTKRVSSGWFGKKEEISEEPWERWVFPIHILPLDFVHRDERRNELQNDLRTILTDIVLNAAQNLDHLPSITEHVKDDITPFPFKIEVSDPSKDAMHVKGFFDSIFKGTEFISIS